ncbi:nuclear transport factor 2 family protein [Chondromyces crocatus]|uniref:SnoaL-like domain-containing protein n=1 Tax=Chondromyces crocatus TaxID=52 RepID=A0A0K1EK77_CHOCO|nr:nuclear transport factor 2 family protein [Chondromyces crocatus]AKT41003.1 uncharacterized protein CMC5_051600 [Chondromyces crocatus]
MNPTIVDIVNASQDALISGDIEKYLSLFAEDVVAVDPMFPPTIGLDALRHHVEALLAALDRPRFVERRIFAIGRSAAFRYTIEANFAGGGPVSLVGVDVFEINDAGRIRSVTSYFDPSAFTAST